MQTQRFGNKGFHSSVCWMVCANAWLLGMPASNAAAWQQESTASVPAAAISQDDSQSDDDSKKVMALMRLPHIDVNEKPKLKATVLRHMQRNETDVDQWLLLAERFAVPESRDRLLQIAVASPVDATSVKSIQLLLALDQLEPLTSSIDACKLPLVPAAEITDSGVEVTPASPAGSLANPAVENAPAIDDAARLIRRLGLVGDAKVETWLQSVVVSADRFPQKIGAESVIALVRSRAGGNFVLELATQQKLPAAVRLTAAQALARHADPEIKSRAASVLPPPAVSDSPLPPISELVLRRGDVAAGQQIFVGIGTCAKCHQVSGQGVSIGPDLTEIGSKLSLDAMYTSIVDPSAAISHNYENYAIETIEGKLFTGLLVSQSDREVILKSTEGVSTTVPLEDIEQMKRLDVSLMPSDLVRVMKEDDLVNLVEYLMTLKKAN